MGDVLHTVPLCSKADSFKEGLLCHIDEPLCFGADGTAGKGCCTISMKALIERAHVNGDNVPLLENVSAGNPVDHHLIDGDARTCREAVKLQKGRFCPLADNKVMNGSVYRLCRNAGLHQGACQFSGGSGDFAGLAHRRNFTFIFDRDHAFAPIAFRISSLAPSMDWLPLTIRRRPSLA